MRFLRELFKELATDIVWLYSRFAGLVGAILYITGVTLVLVGTGIVLSDMVSNGATTWDRFVGFWTLVGVIIIEVVVSIWIWAAAKRAKENIAEENSKLLDTLRGCDESKSATIRAGRRAARKAVR